MYICPICGFESLVEDPGTLPNLVATFEICGCCGWEFGYDNPTNAVFYRQSWMDNGCVWFIRQNKPVGWTPEEQLAGVGITFNSRGEE